ncbi:MAG TPA: ATP synthase F1 subunit gamma [Thermoanaerobaculia bacterium]|jgi:F-type H+-transporting ATPase subunit gamma|nr:ATP synthase F1 subunit gamma [Thermoanaerobaculia bacterium]
MASTIDIRRRIRSTKNMQQLTKAMKMVSAAKLRRAQERIFAARPYAAALREVLSSVATRVEDEVTHPLLQSHENERHVLLVVITADRGLCGAFNSNILRAAMNAIRDRGWESITVLPIGRKAMDFFKRRPFPVRHSAQLMQALSQEESHVIAQKLVEDFTTEKADAVYVIYNEYKSIISQIVRVERLLPIERAWDEQGTAVDYLYEPGPVQILSELLPKHVEYQLYRTLLESAAAEQGARMTAMEAATKNASDMISHLTLTYNRIRQAAITKEIIEIVSGAAAAEG